jgi:glycosyltransferase involved in cell wall biosynthesis
VFVGQGSELPHLRELARRLVPGAVDFPGVVTPQEAATWLRGAKAALVSIRPGLGYDFAKPTKIYAATGCGTPVVFAGVGASRTLVGEQSLGWAVDHDPVAVADAMDAAVAGEAPAPDHLVAWTAAHASLDAACRSAVEAVLERLGQVPAR